MNITRLLNDKTTRFITAAFVIFFALSVVLSISLFYITHHSEKTFTARLNSLNTQSKLLRDIDIKISQLAITTFNLLEGNYTVNHNEYLKLKNELNDLFSIYHKQSALINDKKKSERIKRHWLEFIETSDRLIDASKDFHQLLKETWQGLNSIGDIASYQLKAHLDESDAVYIEKYTLLHAISTGMWQVESAILMYCELKEDHYFDEFTRKVKKVKTHIARYQTMELNPEEKKLLKNALFQWRYTEKKMESLKQVVDKISKDKLKFFHNLNAMKNILHYDMKKSMTTKYNNLMGDN